MSEMLRDLAIAGVGFVIRYDEVDVLDEVLHVFTAATSRRRKSS